MMHLVAAVTFDGGYFLERLKPDTILWHAVWTTVYISIIAQVLGTLLGVLSATAVLSRFWPLRIISGLYTWVFRGTPVLLQIVFWYYGTNLLLGVEVIPRELDLGLFTMSGAAVAGILALGLNEGAYMSEIVRAGILSIDDGQTEAALVVGMTEGAAMRRIVLPQAARLIVPGLGNEFNNMLKTSSLVSVIGATELYADGQVALSEGFKYPEVFVAVALWYLAITTVWLLIQIPIERFLGKSERSSTDGFFKRMFSASGSPRRSYS